MATGWNASDEVGGWTATGTGNTVASGGSGGSMRGVSSHGSGKIYFEFTVTGTIASDGPRVGIASSGYNLFNQPGAGNPSDSVGFNCGDVQEIVYNNAFSGLNTPPGPCAVGDVISCCVDLDNHLIYFLSPGYISAFGATAWNGQATANPATQVGGITFSLTTNAFLVVEKDTAGGIITVNTGGSAYLRTPPSGFNNNWDIWAAAQSGSAFLSGAGAFAGTPVVRHPASATLAGAGSFVPSGAQRQVASGTLAGAGAFNYLLGQANLSASTTSLDTGSASLAGALASLAGTGGGTDVSTGNITTPSIPTNSLQTQNLLVDALFRGQPFITPSTWWVALVTALGSPTTPGTEVTGGSYARASITANLTNWSGTQGAGTTTASSGTSGTVSNNIVITFPAPTADWGTIVGYELWDSPTAGTRWLAGKLQQGLTIANGSAARGFAIGALTVAIA